MSSPNPTKSSPKGGGCLSNDMCLQGYFYVLSAPGDLRSVECFLRKQINPIQEWPSR